MTPEQMRVAIAEACGWKRERSPFTRHGCTVTNNIDGEVWWSEKVAGCFLNCPDFLKSLDAMHEAEKVLTEIQAIEYAACLRKISPLMVAGTPSSFPMLHATALQRATAFVATLNLKAP